MRSLDLIREMCYAFFADSKQDFAREVSPMTKEEIYEHMIGQHIHPHPEIECEFDEGKPCSKLYGNVYAARLRLAKRTGISFEDRDLLEIVESLEKIAELCALKMYDYGVRYAAQ